VFQRPVWAFPPVLVDVGVVVSRVVRAADLVSTAGAAGEPLLRQVDVFDVFRDARFGGDAVSVGLRLAFGADDRTLTEAEASEVRGAIVAALAERHGARLRGADGDATRPAEGDS
jgi:phenylalanyl-tRNA synthetase beta chain